jgi:hypothetical protein
MAAMTWTVDAHCVAGKHLYLYANPNASLTGEGSLKTS